jgi:hypothetical protein
MYGVLDNRPTVCVELRGLASSVLTNSNSHLLILNGINSMVRLWKVHRYEEDIVIVAVGPLRIECLLILVHHEHQLHMNCDKFLNCNNATM